MLYVEELGADELLALLDRAHARDFVDVAVWVDRFGLDPLCELVSESDTGVSRSVLIEMLGSFGRFSPGEFGLTRTADEQPTRSVDQWRQPLSSGRHGVRREPVSPGPTHEVQRISTIGWKSAVPWSDVVQDRAGVAASRDPRDRTGPAPLVVGDRVGG